MNYVTHSMFAADLREGNIVIFGIDWETSAAIASISDNIGNTYIDAPISERYWESIGVLRFKPKRVFCAQNRATGKNTIMVTFSSEPGTTVFHGSELGRRP